ncbi:MAG: OmpA family protein [Desulfovibrionaceae bacterium]
MSRLTRILTILITLCLGMALAVGSSFAATKLVPKVDNFILFVDHSGSMDMSYQGKSAKKIVLAKDMLAKMNAAIPELGYTSAVFTFAPFKGYSQPAAYSKSAVGAAVAGLQTNYDPFLRMTPMGDGLISLDSVLAGLTGKTAVIIVTDGNSNEGSDPVAQAQALYAKYQGKVCFHVVSYADEAHGKMVVEEIRALNNCSVPAEGAALVGDDAVMKKFVKDVFFTEAAAPVAAPKAAEAMNIVLRINFDFDSYAIRADMVPVLEQAQLLLSESPNQSVVVEGWTDYVGTDKYNATLSANRANAVKNWLVKHGVDEARMQAVGKGKSFKYDNKTSEGRFMNRRVEIIPAK